MTHEPIWSLITVSHNSAQQLAKSWNQVTPLIGRDVEWIVVDNDSDDDSASLAKRLGATVITLPKNIGFGAANNNGFRHSSGRYVAFINPDVHPVINDLEVLQKILDDHPTALVAPQLCNIDGTIQPNGRSHPYLVSKLCHRLYPKLNTGYRIYGAPRTLTPVAWLMGAMVAGAREHLMKLGTHGPWDEAFFLYYEDADICIRNSAIGGQSLIVGDLQWAHGWGRATSRADFHAWRHEMKSMMTFYRRYPRLALSLPRMAGSATT